MERARALPHQRSLTSELPQAGWRWSRMTWLITFASWPRRAWLLLRLVSLCETALACHRLKTVTGNHILRILKTNGVAPSLPEDLYYLIKKAVSVRKHLDKNRKDKDAKFRLILVESRIHRLARYYKRVKSLPATFKYQSSTASALVAWVRLVDWVNCDTRSVSAPQLPAPCNWQKARVLQNYGWVRVVVFSRAVAISLLMASIRLKARRDVALLASALVYSLNAVIAKLLLRDMSWPQIWYWKMT